MTSLFNLPVERVLLQVLVVLHDLHPVRVVSSVLWAASERASEGEKTFASARGGSAGERERARAEELTLVVLYLLMPGTPLAFCSVHSRVMTTLTCFPFFAMHVTCLVGAVLLGTTAVRPKALGMLPRTIFHSSSLFP